MNVERMDSSWGMQDLSSKSITQTIDFFLSSQAFGFAKAKEEAPIDTAGLLVAR
jgi:hypothetical protein